MARSMERDYEISYRGMIHCFYQEKAENRSVGHVNDGGRRKSQREKRRKEERRELTA